jgi:hypothetical protein
MSNYSTVTDAINFPHRRDYNLVPQGLFKRREKREAILFLQVFSNQ